MSLKFNPVTGQLDLVETQTAGQTPQRDQIVVDSNFLNFPVETLDFTAITNSEFIFLNGLYICETEYSLAGTTFTWFDSNDLRVGDVIDIRFNS